jgi:hypothetical protein
MKETIECYVWHDAKKHKPPTFGQYLVADYTVEGGYMWVAEWDWVIHPDPKHGYWDCPSDYDEHIITHWATINPPTINKQFQWTNIQDPLPVIKATSPSKSPSAKKSSSTSTP